MTMEEDDKPIFFEEPVAEPVIEQPRVKRKYTRRVKVEKEVIPEQLEHIDARPEESAPQYTEFNPPGPFRLTMRRSHVLSNKPPEFVKFEGANRYAVKPQRRGQILSTPYLPEPIANGRPMQLLTSKQRNEQFSKMASGVQQGLARARMNIHTPAIGARISKVAQIAMKTKKGV